MTLNFARKDLFLWAWFIYLLYLVFFRQPIYLHLTTSNLVNSSSIPTALLGTATNELLLLVQTGQAILQHSHLWAYTQGKHWSTCLTHKWGYSPLQNQDSVTLLKSLLCTKHEDFYGVVTSKWTKKSYFSSTGSLFLRNQLLPGPTPYCHCISVRIITCRNTNK